MRMFYEYQNQDKYIHKNPEEEIQKPLTRQNSILLSNSNKVQNRVATVVNNEATSLQETAVI